jgi:hypothetical protein
MNIHAVRKKYVGRLAFVGIEVTGFSVPARFVTLFPGDALLFLSITRDRKSHGWMTIHALSKHGFVYVGCNDVVLEQVFEYG